MKSEEPRFENYDNKTTKTGSWQRSKKHSALAEASKRRRGKSRDKHDGPNVTNNELKGRGIEGGTHASKIERRAAAARVRSDGMRRRSFSHSTKNDFYDDRF